MSWSKPYLSFEEQILRISEYGISIDSLEDAIVDLRRLGYYRLSGYWYPHRLPDPNGPEGALLDRVHEGVRFRDIVQMCDFDDELRSLLLEALGTVELSIRVSIAYRLGRYGGMAYLFPEAWSQHQRMTPSPEPVSASQSPPESPFETFLRKHREMVERAKEDFVVHFKTRYGGDIPIWAAIELWDFGTLSRAFRMLKPEDRQVVAGQYRVSHRVFGSWLVALNDLRNFCAHHARLSRRVYVNKPRIPRSTDLPEFSHIPLPEPGDKERLYSLLCVLAFLERQIRPLSKWRDQVVGQFSKLEDMQWGNPSAYGLPDGWRAESLWADP